MVAWQVPGRPRGPAGSPCESRCASSSASEVNPTVSRRVEASASRLRCDQLHQIPGAAVSADQPGAQRLAHAEPREDVDLEHLHQATSSNDVHGLASDGLPAEVQRAGAGSEDPGERWNRVVLPAPLGPITEWIEPRRTSRSTPSTARKVPNVRREPLALRRTSSLIGGLLSSAGVRQACQAHPAGLPAGTSRSPAAPPRAPAPSPRRSAPARRGRTGR